MHRIPRTAGLAVVIALLGTPVAAQRIITTIVGDARAFQGNSGPAVEARLITVWGVAVGPSGNIYLADQDPANNLVVRISPDGLLEVFAGNGIDGFSGDGGAATNASVAGPLGVAADAAGNLFIADSLNNRIRRVSVDGTIETVAGSENRGFSGDDGPAVSASLDSPQGVAVDSAGNLFIADTENHRVRQVSPDGVIRTVAGNGNASFSGDGGPAIGSSLDSPTDVAVDGAGNLFIADSRNDRVRQISPDGTIRTFAGTGIIDFSGDGGQATSASLALPLSVAFDAAGNLFIADSENDRVRRVSPDGVIETVAGNGDPGFSGDGGPAADASLAFPRGVAVDGAGALLISDSGNNRLRQVGLDGVIRTVAGMGFSFFAGDGGPASDAALLNPESIATDAAGNLFIADSLDHRVRQVSSDGTIRTVAGNGQFGFAGDGGLAIDASLGSPRGLALDVAGDLLVSDSFNNRIRRVSSDGVIRTVVGDGEFDFFGDGGPAATASLAAPREIAMDAAGRLWIADTENDRLRQVSPGGVIQTVAGNGDAEFSGDGGPATNASLSLPRGVALDSAGALFIADTDNHRVRRVGSDGVISTVAGTGDIGYSGDGAAAVGATFDTPTSVAVDSSGTLLIADFNNNRVRQVGPDGVIQTLAGNGGANFSGDGGLASLASVDRPQALALDQVGNIFIAEHLGRIRVVLSDPPRFSDLSAQEIRLTAPSGGAPVEAESVLISAASVNLPLLQSGSLPQVDFSANVSTDSDWLSVSPALGSTQRLLRIRADPFDLAPGEYDADVQVDMPVAEPSQRNISVHFSVGLPAAPRLSVDTDSFSFTYPSGAPARREGFAILNTGGDTLGVAVQTETDSGGAWLSVTPANGTATPSALLAIDVSADPAGLPTGSYTGRLRVEADAEGSPAVIPVTMTISAGDQAILLTQRGLSFTAVARGGVVPPQTFGVVNLGRGAMEWTVATCTVAGPECSWLQVTPERGASDPASEVPQVTATVDQNGLAPGDYYGLVEVRSPEAANTPQVMTVFLEVLPESSDPGAALTANDLVFTGFVGGDSPGSQDIFVYNVAAEPKSYRSSRSIGAGRLEILPTNAGLDPREPTRIVVQPFTDGVPAGEYEGNVTLQFTDGRVQEVGLKLVVADSVAGVSSKSESVSQGACTPQKLLPAVRTLGAGFAVSAGWPVGLQVDVKDDCGQPLRQGNVVVEFSNGDPELAMTSLRNGRWDGTWQTNARQLADVTLRVEATEPGLNLSGATEIRGGLRSRQRAPIVPPNGVVSAAAIVAHQPLAPGSLITLFGLDLSLGLGVADALPLPETIQGATVFIGGRPMPLLFASSGQVNAMAPFGLSLNTSLQIVVQRGTTLSLPVAVNMAAAQPAVFKTDPRGSQGHIYRVVEGLQVLAGPGSPAQAGEALIIYSSGLGEVSPMVNAGEPAPSAEPLARTVNPVSVTIGNQPAVVFFAGLSPGFSGLYQVNVLVPEEVESAEQVRVLLETAGQTSQPVAIAVR